IYIYIYSKSPTARLLRRGKISQVCALVCLQQQLTVDLTDEIFFFGGSADDRRGGPGARKGGV
ncbi:MAG: hypothetical protein ACK55Z_06480, partial [bacterium]